MIKEFGGYLELELEKGEEYHPKALRLNTGRNCLEYVLRSQKIRKLFLPYYICDVILEPLQKLNIDYEFYHIDQDFSPLFSQSCGDNESLLYVNYFGLKQKTIETLSKHYNRLIVDNTQAFFAKPIEQVDSFYSARKFFGVPDGAYLYTERFLNQEIQQDYSYTRMTHLLKRIDINASDGYADFIDNDLRLVNQPIKRMSKLTQALLKNIDYQNVKLMRERNFFLLHYYLSHLNQLEIDIEQLNGPMIYPFFSDRKELKSRLIEHKIYVPTYWKNVLKWVDSDSVEYKLSNNLMLLPIDQRYKKNDIKVIADTILKEYK